MLISSLPSVAGASTRGRRKARRRPNLFRHRQNPENQVCDSIAGQDVLNSHTGSRSHAFEPSQGDKASAYFQLPDGSKLRPPIRLLTGEQL